MMYFFEWGSWQMKIEPEEARKNDIPLVSQAGKKLNLSYESEEIKEQAAARLCVSQSPVSRGPVYKYDDCTLEMRCGLLESKRGLLTLLTMMPFIFFIQLGPAVLIFTAQLIELYLKGSSYIHLLYPIIFISIVLTIALWAYLKFGLRFSRLELFTSRHLLIRFNRKTQQVYLHRPSYCGGIATLPWAGVTSTGADLAAPEVLGVGVPLMLHWSSRVTGTLQPELICVGKAANYQSDLRNEWEFIRRFMEEGPQGLPRPSITSHFPWPWQGFAPQFEGLTHYFFNAGNKLKLGLILIWPAFLVFGLAHWLSLILCWKPRWPKIIRQAGMPGKPVPALTTLADYPAHIQQRLRENAHLWHVQPGSPPEKSPAKPRTRRNKGASST